MSDEHTTDTPAGEPADAGQTGQPAGEAWHEVIAQLDALGEAMGRWARAATHDPANQERAAELKEHVKKMTATVEGAVDEVASSDVGQSFREAAAKTGEAFRAAGDKVAGEVSPRVASAFRTTAEKLHQAAERMEGQADRVEDTAGGEGAGGEAPAAGDGEG